MTKWKIKDFEIKAYKTGSQLKNSAEWCYKVIWNGKEVKRGFSRKLDARNFIRRLVKVQNHGINALTV